MSKNKSILIGTVFTLMSAGACSDDDGGGGSGVSTAKLYEVCDTMCETMDECGNLGSVTLATCRSECKSQIDSRATSNNSNCNPSQNEVDSCLSTVKNATCEELQFGVEGCEVCEDDDTINDNNTSDGGISSEIDCAYLADCCAAIEDTNVKESCDNFVNEGEASLCDNAYESYYDNFCPGI